MIRKQCCGLKMFIVLVILHLLNTLCDGKITPQIVTTTAQNGTDLFLSYNAEAFNNTNKYKLVNIMSDDSLRLGFDGCNPSSLTDHVMSNLLKMYSIDKDMDDWVALVHFNRSEYACIEGVYQFEDTLFSLLQGFGKK